MQQQTSLWDLMGSPAHDVLSSLSPSDLRSMSLVASSWRLMSEPYLYAAFKCVYRPDYGDGHVQDQTFERFLRTILQRPRLGYHVKSLHLKGDHDFRKSLDPPPRVEIQSFLDAAMRAVTAVHQDLPGGPNFVRQWQDLLLQGSRGACITLLLSQLPNLQELKLGDAYTEEVNILGSYIRAETKRSPLQYSALRRLTLLTADNKRLCEPNGGRPIPSATASNMLPFFYLPSVEQLSVALGNPVTFSWPGAMPPDLSNISYLQLRLIREVHLKLILGLTSRVRVLEYEWCYDMRVDHVNNPAALHLDILATSIELVKDTIEELTLCAMFPPENTEEDNPVNPYIDLIGDLRSLASCPHLHTLTAPMFFLTAGWDLERATQRIGDVLPRAIRQVKITGDLWWHGYNNWYADMYATVLDDWLCSWRTTHPHLENICLVMRSYDLCKRSSIEPMFLVGRKYGVIVGVQKIQDDGNGRIFRSDDTEQPWEVLRGTAS